MAVGSRIFLMTAFASALLTGCTFSGLSGSSDKFSCAAPAGVSCTSMSGAFANAKAGNLPEQITSKARDLAAGNVTKDSQNQVNTATTGGYLQPAPRVTPSSGMPIRSAPKTVRVWIAPWEDSDGDLHDQKYIYMTVNDGQWMIERNRAAIRESNYPMKAYNSRSTTDENSLSKSTPKTVSVTSQDDAPEQQ